MKNLKKATNSWFSTVANNVDMFCIFGSIINDFLSLHKKLMILNIFLLLQILELAICLSDKGGKNFRI